MKEQICTVISLLSLLSLVHRKLLWFGQFSFKMNIQFSTLNYIIFVNCLNVEVIERDERFEKSI